MDILLVNPDHGVQNNFPWGTLAVGSYLKNVKNFKVKIQTYTVDTMTLDLNEREFHISDPDYLWKGRSFMEKQVLHGIGTNQFLSVPMN